MKDSAQHSSPGGIPLRVYHPNGCNKAILMLILLSGWILAGCNALVGSSSNPDRNEHQAATEVVTLPPSTTPVPSATMTPSPTYTHTPSPTASLPPTETPTLTFTPTPTSEFPLARILMQAFCRYGPAKAYLYSHGLYEGDLAEVHGRNFNSHWLWIKPANLDRHCWAAASVMEVSGDVSGVPVVQTRLPHSTLYGPPGDVQAVRDGDRVTVTWNRVDMTLDDDRGYLIEATVCQNGVTVSIVVQTNDNYYEFTDEQNCSGTSGGELYTVEKHGYTDPVDIPWP